MSTTVDYHRNGVMGEGFWNVHLDDPDNGRMMCVVFPPEGFSEENEPMFPRAFHNPHVAVFQESKLPDTTFGENSWRGDEYADRCYVAIEDHIKSGR